MDLSSIVIDCDIDTIYHFMSNVQKINLWSMGIEWDIETNDTIIQGFSNYDESKSYLKLVKNYTIKKIDYWIGKERNDLSPRIYVRITPTSDQNKNKLMMVSFRTDDMDDERWNHLKELHQKELLKIKELLSDCDLHVNIAPDNFDASTVILEAMMMGKPTLNIQLQKNEIEFEFMKENAIKSVYYDSNIEQLVLDLISNHGIEELLNNSQNFLNKYMKNRGNAAKKLNDLMMKN